MTRVKAMVLDLISTSVFPDGKTTMVATGSKPIDCSQSETVENEGRPRRPIIEDEPQLEIVATETLDQRNERRLRELRDLGAFTGL